MGINKNYKRGIFLLILLLSVISGTLLIQNSNQSNVIDDSALSTSAPEDFYEPNNDPFSAYDLTMWELTWLSFINGPGTQWDDDWYKIEIKPGYERLIVKLIFHHMEGDIDLEVYNNSQDLITGSYSVEDGEFIDIILPSGQYYLKVYYGNNGSIYDLLWNDMDPALTDDFYEENDDPASASINANIAAHQGKWLSQINELGIQADDDWFEIYINPGFERLIVECIFSNDLGNIDLDIYNSSLVRMTESWTDQNREFIDYVVPSSGVYYIRLHYGNGNNTYDLRWMTFVPGDDFYEDNDDYWTSRWIDPNYHPNLMIVNGDEDWFHLYLNHGVTIEVYIYFSNAQGNLNLELYDPFDSLTYRMISNSSTMDSEYISFTADSFGDWRIRIYHEDANSTVPYDLDIWLLSGDDWAEENDDFWSAFWLGEGNFGGLMIVDYDQDWFQTHLEPGDTIDISIRFDHNIGDLQLELFHPDNHYVIGSYISNPTYHEEHISFQVQDPGEWRIRVYRISGISDEIVNYDLEIWIHKKDPGRDDPYEWNNYPEEAYYLGRDEQTWLADIHGPAVSGDDDWYAIEMTPGFNHLIVDLKFNNSHGNIDISIIDKHNSWFIENTSRTSVDGIDINCMVPHPGIYFIRIFGDFMMNQYNLGWDDLRTDFRSEDFYEENDNAASAYDLSYEIDYMDEHGIVGRPLWYINGPGIQSDNDWYKLEVGPEFLKLIVVVLYEYDAGALGIEIYDWDISKLTDNFTMDDNEYISFVLPSNGTYYIRIFGDNTGSPYGIIWWLNEYSEGMIPGYDILILLGAIFGVSTVISIKWKRSKKNL